MPIDTKNRETSVSRRAMPFWKGRRRGSREFPTEAPKMVNLGRQIRGARVWPSTNASSRSFGRGAITGTTCVDPAVIIVNLAWADPIKAPRTPNRLEVR